MASQAQTTCFLEINSLTQLARRAASETEILVILNGEVFFSSSAFNTILIRPPLTDLKTSAKT